jgi:hypothetical protein
MLVATTVWTIDPGLVLALDERLGPPVDSYLNGSQTWLVDDVDGMTLEFRLHPVASYSPPRGVSHDDVWEAVVTQISNSADPHALRLGEDVRPLTSLWDGLECFAAYGDDVEPARLAASATSLLGVRPQRQGLVDHEAIGDAWERTRGKVSIVALLLEQLAG